MVMDSRYTKRKSLSEKPTAMLTFLFVIAFINDIVTHNLVGEIALKDYYFLLT